MKLGLKTEGRWLPIAIFCVVGSMMAAVHVLYLVIASPQPGAKLETILGYLCPFSVLTIVFIDTPDATTMDYVVLWTLVAILNAGLYGAVGSVLIKLDGKVRGT